MGLAQGKQTVHLLPVREPDAVRHLPLESAFIVERLFLEVYLPSGVDLVGYLGCRSSWMLHCSLPLSSSAVIDGGGTGDMMPPSVPPGLCESHCWPMGQDEAGRLAGLLALRVWGCRSMARSAEGVAQVLS